MDFSVPMALADFVPVILFLAGAIILQRDLYNKMSKGAFALFACGTINVFCAGALKALYKLLYAAGVCDFQPLSAMFFPVQSIGFILAGLGLVALLTHRQGKTAAVAAPALFSGTFIFVGMMVAGVISIAACMSVLCKKLGRGKLAVFFIVQAVCCMCMGYLSSKDFAQAYMNWLAEGINIVGQSCFLLGCVKAHKAGLAELTLAK